MELTSGGVLFAIVEQVAATLAGEKIDLDQVEQEEMNAFDLFMNDQKDILDGLSGKQECNQARTTLFEDFKIFEKENIEMGMSALNFDIPNTFVFD